LLTVSGGWHIRILRIVSDLYPHVVGGLGLHAHEISKWQSEHGNEVKVISIRGSKTNGFKRSYEVQEFNSIMKPKGNAIAPSMLSAILRQQGDFDILHAHSHLFFSTNMGAFARRIGDSPLVITNHGMISTNMPKWVQDIYMPTIAKWTLESAERIICYTKEDAEAVMDLGIGEGRIAIIHNGVDIELFSPQYREPSDEVRLVWSGRFVPGKGVDTLIDAFALALKENPKLHLLLVGDGPQKDQIEAQIARLKVRDKVTINTYVPNNEMPDVYRSSSIFVLTSHYEGVPRTILESMACGLPVICTDLPQLRPIVGGNGILVPVYSAKGFAEAILALASDESMRRRMGASGSELIRRNYSWDSAMRETIELYKTVIEERKRPR